jgi:pimeloyl-ACP methyl ester carboxylesterase
VNDRGGWLLAGRRRGILLAAFGLMSACAPTVVKVNMISGAAPPTVRANFRAASDLTALNQLRREMLKASAAEQAPEGNLLSDAVVAQEKAIAPGTSPAQRQVYQEQHNARLGEYLARKGRLSPTYIETTGNESVTVRVNYGPDLWASDYFDSYVDCRHLSYTGLVGHFSEAGFGAVMAGVRPNRLTTVCEGYFPTEGIIQPVTAVVERRGKDVHLSLYNPRKTSHVRWSNGTTSALALDYSTPFAVLLAKTRFGIEKYQWFFRDVRFERRQRLVVLEPYDPNKIPVLMIHGLLSSPISWRNLTNAIYGDPELRRKYQVWHYMYPTGAPLFTSAKRLRDDLDELHAHIAKKREPQPKPMVVIAHSMGGLLARTLVTETGNDLLDFVFQGGFNEFKAEPAVRDRIHDLFVFHPRRDVARVVFLATPHRGSSLADLRTARWLAALARLPNEAGRPVLLALQANRHLIRPDLHWMVTRRFPSSIHSLSPRNGILLRLADVPVDRRIPFNNIVARLPGLHSDGVVPVTSATMTGAESQIEVASGHTVQERPAAVAELMRILRSHGPQYVYASN